MDRRHYQMEDFGTMLRYTIPSRKQWGHVIGTCVVFVGFTAIVLVLGRAVVPAVVNVLLTGNAGLLRTPFGLVMVLWFVNFSYGSVELLLTLLWLVAGKDILEVVDFSVRLRREVSGWGASRSS